jgi:hypothetical protein
MKRTLTTLILALCVLIANAQFLNRGGGSQTGLKTDQVGSTIINTNKAVGDTLMYTNGYYWYPSATDAASFAIEMYDADMLTPNNSTFFMSFGSFYDTSYTADWWFPWDADTAWYFAATSWFSPAGTADNWLMFGPVTVPAGAEISWYQRYNGSGGTPPFWFDGYEVIISTSFVDFTSFVDPPIFIRNDYTGSDGTDSSWAMKTVVIPSVYVNQPLYFAFHHNATDMDVLYIDEIKIVETAAGVDEVDGGINYVNNSPNPANQSTTVNYKLDQPGNVVLQVTDVEGRIVKSQEFGVQNSGVYKYVLNTSDLSSGLYFYSLTVNNQKVVNKLIIQK